MTNKLVGKHFAGYSTKHNRTAVYVCYAVDKDSVYVRNINDQEDAPALSHRAINRSYHMADQNDVDTAAHPNRWYVYGLWHQYINL